MRYFLGILFLIVVVCIALMWINILRKPKLHEDIEKIRFHWNFLGNRLGCFLKYTNYILMLVLIGLIVYSIILKKYDEILSLTSPIALTSFNMMSFCSEYIITNNGVGKTIFRRIVVFYNWEDIISYRPIGNKRICYEFIDKKGIRRSFDQYTSKREFKEIVEFLDGKISLN